MNEMNLLTPMFAILLPLIIGFVVVGLIIMNYRMNELFSIDRNLKESLRIFGPDSGPWKDVHKNEAFVYPRYEIGFWNGFQVYLFCDYGRILGHSRNPCLILYFQCEVVVPLLVHRSLWGSYDRRNPEWTRLETDRYSGKLQMFTQKPNQLSEFFLKGGIDQVFHLISRIPNMNSFSVAEAGTDFHEYSGVRLMISPYYSEVNLADIGATLELISKIPQEQEAAS